MEMFKTEPNRNREKFEDPWTEPNRTETENFQTEPNRTEKSDFLKFHQKSLQLFNFDFNSFVLFQTIII
jgi:hypothetical protein